MTYLYLASQSPRRRELLQQIGVEYSLVEVAVVEQREPGEPATDYVCRLAQEKAQAGLQRLQQQGVIDAVVLGADTLGVMGAQVFEKPVDQDHARHMLRQLSGACHDILSAVALVDGQRHAVHLVQTRVCFRELTDTEIESYWRTGEPCDKAGAYAIQGLGAIFVKSIEGSYSGVVGLPLTETAALLRDFNIPLWRDQIRE